MKKPSFLKKKAFQKGAVRNSQACSSFYPVLRESPTDKSSAFVQAHAWKNNSRDQFPECVGLWYCLLRIGLTELGTCESLETKQSRMLGEGKSSIQNPSGWGQGML